MVSSTRKHPGFALGVVVAVAASVALLTSGARATFAPGDKASGRAVAPETYAIADLGSLGGASIASGINDRGDVAGCAAFAGSTCDRAVLYADGQVLNLGTLPGGAFSIADGINNRGEVVGTASIPNSPGLPFGHAFLFTDDQMTDLGTLGGTWSQAFGVNASATVVGGAYTAGDTTQHAFLYRDGQMTDINPPGGTTSVALGINSSGVAVGLAYFAGGVRGFLWRGGSTVTLGTLGGAGGDARAINAAGDVVGGANTTTGSVHAYVDRNGQMLDLGSLGGTQGLSQAEAINNAGDVVGVSGTGPGRSALHAFLWNGSTMVDLNDLIDVSSGWELEEATGINDRGQIAGFGIYNGQERAFLLTPRRIPG